MAAAEVIDQSELLWCAFSTTKKESKKSTFVLPKELYEKDAALGVRVLVKTFSLVTLGLIFTLYMPTYLSPVGMLLTGCGMSMLYLVGFQCKQSTYFDSKVANSIARELTNLPLMEGWIGRVFFVALMSCLCYYLGPNQFLSGFLKLWVFPALIMRLNLRHLSKKDTNAIIALFPSLPPSAENLLESVPFYKIDRAFEVLSSSPSSLSSSIDNTGCPPHLVFSSLWETLCSLVPSHYMMCEFMYWKKRDFLLEFVLALTLAIAPLHYSEVLPLEAFYLPLCVLFLGFTCKAHATSLVSPDGWLASTSNSLSSTFQKLKSLSPQLHWFNITYLGVVHLWALMGLYTALPVASYESLLFCFFLHNLYGLGITAGAHRLWSHRAYKASLPVRIFLMMLNCGSNQGTIWHWSRDHRAHHHHSDTEQDPHNSGYGFFFAHCGWLFLKKDKLVVDAGRAVNLEDLKRDGVVMFQKKHYFPLAMFFCFGLPTIIPVLCWGEDWFVALTLSYVKYAVSLNAAWCVNSLAHFVGMHPYRPESPTAENWLVSLMAVGEGWHNYHHAYPWDYAASEFGASIQFNPTKIFIDSCAALGLVSDRKRADHLGRVARARVEAAKKSQK